MTSFPLSTFSFNVLLTKAMLENEGPDFDEVNHVKNPTIYQYAQQLQGHVRRSFT